MNHESAIEALVALPSQGKRAASFGRSWLNLSGRRVSAIRRKHTEWCKKNGFSNAQIDQAWIDVKDVVELEKGAE
jgi:hypothetical protein